MSFISKKLQVCYVMLQKQILWHGGLLLLRVSFNDNWFCWINPELISVSVFLSAVCGVHREEPSVCAGADSGQWTVQQPTGHLHQSAAVLQPESRITHNVYTTYTQHTQSYYIYCDHIAVCFVFSLLCVNQQINIKLMLNSDSLFCQWWIRSPRPEPQREVSVVWLVLLDKQQITD